MSIAILQGDARSLPLPDSSVDLVITSPPYFGQRKYRDDDGLIPQIGAEESPQEYIKALMECTAEMVRVLKPSGSIFVNLGDKYAGQRYRSSAPAKSLMLIPERYRLACLDELKLTVRAVNIWAKPHGLPDPATDRHGRMHEDWVHLTRNGSYYSDIDAIREPHADGDHRGMSYRERVAAGLDTKRKGCRGADIGPDDAMPSLARHPLGKTPRSVWSVPVRPLRVPSAVAHAVCCDGQPRPGCVDGVKHTAAFPPRMIAPLVEAFSPPGGSVLDPFGGTGTVAMVADILGCEATQVEVSKAYNRVAAWRTADPKERARVTGATA